MKTITLTFDIDVHCAMWLHFEVVVLHMSRVTMKV